jgi:hypothetical protein
LSFEDILKIVDRDAATRFLPSLGAPNHHIS